MSYGYVPSQALLEVDKDEDEMDPRAKIGDVQMPKQTHH